jgi:hypothetical protein
MDIERAMSERVQMVLDHPIDQMTAGELGEKLGIKASTAKSYVYIMRKVGGTRKFLVPDMERKRRLAEEAQELRLSQKRIPLDAATWDAYQRELFTAEQMVLHFRLV